MTKQKPEAGTIGWRDLTVPDAGGVRAFYEQVVGWKHAPVSMGDYDDFSMLTPDTGTGVAGICHARGANADLPAQWLVYINVDNLDASLQACVDGGGQVLSGPRHMPGYGRYAVIQDPAGAACALFEHEAGGEQ